MHNKEGTIKFLERLIDQIEEYETSHVISVEIDRPSRSVPNSDDPDGYWVQEPTGERVVTISIRMSGVQP